MDLKKLFKKNDDFAEKASNRGAFFIALEYSQSTFIWKTAREKGVQFRLGKVASEEWVSGGVICL